jgi:RIO-like serine/threonine protein kinase
MLPGPAREWNPPMETDAWNEILAEIGRSIGNVSEFAIYERRQSGRQGFGMLLFQDHLPVAFMRVNVGDKARIAREYTALRHLTNATPTSFRYPKPIAMGQIGEFSFLLTSALQPGRHRVADNAPITLVTKEINNALANLARPATIPPHWLPMHGDFTPWNLRASPDGELFLYDWENVGWGPPGADEVLYQAVTAVAFRRKMPVTEFVEACNFWHERAVNRSRFGKKEQAFKAALARVLAPG